MRASNGLKSASATARPIPIQTLLRIFFAERPRARNPSSGERRYDGVEVHITGDVADKAASGGGGLRLDVFGDFICSP